MRASNLGEALKEFGFDQFEHQAQTVASNFIKAGGTREKWLAVYDAAEGMSGMVPRDSASTGLHQFDRTRQQVEGGGANVSVSKDQPPRAPSPSTNRSHGGHDNRAVGHTRITISVREPTASQRSASLLAAKSASITIMDTFKIDGLAIGEWSVARARVEGRRKTRDGYILRESVKLVANASPHALLRSVVKIEEMQRIRQAAEEAADAI